MYAFYATAALLYFFFFFFFSSYFCMHGLKERFLAHFRLLRCASCAPNGSRSNEGMNMVGPHTKCWTAMCAWAVAVCVRARTMRAEHIIRVCVTTCVCDNVCVVMRRWIQTHAIVWIAVTYWIELNFVVIDLLRPNEITANANCNYFMFCT